MKNTCLFLFVSINLFFACSGNQSIPSSPILCPVERVVVDPLRYEPFTKEFYGVSKAIQFKCAAPKIDKISFYNDKFFILDAGYTKEVYVFNQEGELLNTYGRIGHGPGEFYQGITDFEIDRKNELLYLFEKESKKLVIHQVINGDFKEAIVFKKYWPYGFSLLNNGHFGLIFRMRDKLRSDNFEFIITDREEKNIASYRALNFNHLFTPNRLPIQRTNDYLYFLPNLCDTIFSIGEDSISYATFIDFGKYALPQEMKKDIMRQKEEGMLNLNGYVRSIEKYLENEYWLHIAYNYSGVKIFYLKDKVTGATYNGSSLFGGFLPSEIIALDKESIVVALGEEDFLKYYDLKEANYALWQELCKETNETVLDAIEGNKPEENNITIVYLHKKE